MQAAALQLESQVEPPPDRAGAAAQSTSSNPTAPARQGQGGVIGSPQQGQGGAGKAMIVSFAPPAGRPPAEAPGRRSAALRAPFYRGNIKPTGLNAYLFTLGKSPDKVGADSLIA